MAYTIYDLTSATTFSTADAYIMVWVPDQSASRKVLVDDLVNLTAMKITDTDGDIAEVIEGANTSVKGLRVYGGPTDPVSDIPVGIDFAHHQVHEGETYRAQDVQASLGTNTVKYAISVTTYADTIKAPHMVITADVYNGAALVQVYNESTFTGGSAITSYNRNRNSTNLAGSSVYTGVTATIGNLMESFYAGSGRDGSGTGRASSEWILKSNTKYRVDVIGQTAGTAAIVGFDWYEDLGV